MLAIALISLAINKIYFPFKSKKKHTKQIKWNRMFLMGETEALLEKAFAIF